jgi:hypothetical protein
MTGLLMLGLMAACAPTYTRKSGPAPENALSCSQASLERMGFALKGAPGSGDAFKASRTADQYWVYRVEHQMRVSTTTRGTPVLKLDAERVEVKDLTNQPMQHQRGVTAYDPPMVARRLDPDPVLKDEVEQVIQDCGGSVRGTTGLAR